MNIEKLFSFLTVLFDFEITANLYIIISLHAYLLQCINSILVNIFVHLLHIQLSKLKLLLFLFLVKQVSFIFFRFYLRFWFIISYLYKIQSFYIFFNFILFKLFKSLLLLFFGWWLCNLFFDLLLLLELVSVLAVCCVINLSFVISLGFYSIELYFDSFNHPKITNYLITLFSLALMIALWLCYSNLLILSLCTLQHLLVVLHLSFPLLNYFLDQIQRFIQVVIANNFTVWSNRYV